MSVANRTKIERFIKNEDKIKKRLGSLMSEHEKVFMFRRAKNLLKVSNDPFWFKKQTRGDTVD